MSTEPHLTEIDVAAVAGVATSSGALHRHLYNRWNAFQGELTRTEGKAARQAVVDRFYAEFSGWRDLPREKIAAALMRVSEERKAEQVRYRREQASELIARLRETGATVIADRGVITVRGGTLSDFDRVQIAAFKDAILEHLAPVPVGAETF